MQGVGGEVITDKEYKSAVCPYSDKVRKDIQQLIDDEIMNRIAPITAWTSIVSILIEEHIAYYMELDCALMLTHPKNRNGLLLNPHNATRIIQLIKRTGADLKELQKAACFELSTDPSIRKRQIAANEACIKRAGGILADINGSERYLSVSCGHTSAGCRAVKQGAKSSVDELTGGEDSLHRDMVVGKDAIFASMIDKGWLWLVIPAIAELVWPQLANLGVKALNASNNTTSTPSEIQTAALVAELRLAHHIEGTLDASLLRATVLATNPVCADYLDVVMDWSERFGGGDNAQIILFLEMFASKFGASLRLGEDYLCALVYTKLDKADVGRYPMDRTCLLSACDKSGATIEGRWDR